MAQYLKKKIKSKKKSKNVIQYEEVDEQEQNQDQQQLEGSQINDSPDYMYENDSQIIMNHQDNNINASLFQNVDITDSNFEELKTEDFDPNRIMVESDAWPDQQDAKVKSKIHKLLRREMTQIDPSKIYFNELENKHLKEVKQLHEEWFPLSYPDTFYDKIHRKTVIAVGCFIDLDKQNKNVILGTILVKINTNNDEIAEMYKSKDYHASGILSWLKTTITCREYAGAYIMTLGIVDECRRMGLGTMLLNQAIKILNQSMTHCEVIYLHVVDYNETAMRFYEKNNFRTLKRIRDHYVIFEKNYDALVLYRDIKFNTLKNHDNEKNMSDVDISMTSERPGYLSYLTYPIKYVFQKVYQTNQ